ncbi:hypothetical protein Tco_1154209 [Tanacetum coccineum]
MRSGLKLSKLYMVRKVALITMVASITVRRLELLVPRIFYTRITLFPIVPFVSKRVVARLSVSAKILGVGDSPFYIIYNRLYRLESEKDCLIINCINHGQWRWNWSRPNLGAQNSANLLDMLFEISSSKIKELEDTCVWSLGTDGTFSIKDVLCIIDSKILPSLASSTV